MKIKATSKKLLAAALAFALLLSCIVVPGVIASAEAETLDIWDGTSDAAPVDSDNDGIYEISTPEQLANYVANNGKVDGATKTAILTCDIWLNDMLVTVTDGVPSATKATDTSVVIDLTDDENNGLNEWFDGVADMWFVGTIDGNGHVVNGLYVKQNADYTYNCGGGLINRAGGGTVKNLGIENAYMYSVHNFSNAFIVGSVHSATATVDSCYVGASAYHENINSAAPAIVGGGGKGATVTNCYTLATSKHVNTKMGVIIGDSWGKEKIYNCYTANGYNCRRTDDSGIVENSYSLTSAPGKNAPSAMPNLGSAFVITDGYPELKVFQDEPRAWGGWLAQPASGTGSAADPFIITNGEELAYAINNTGKVYVEDENGTYKYNEESSDYEELSKDEEYDGTLYSYVAPSFKLANDIYLNDLDKIDWMNGTVSDGYTVRSWYRDIAVQGSFDGDGHMVYGLYYNAKNGVPGTVWYNNASVALFPRALHGGTLNVTGIGIDCAYLNGDSAAAGFVGAKNGSGGSSQAATNCYINISESFVGEKVHLIAYDTGAALAVNHGNTITVTDFYSLAKQTANSRTGLVADNWAGKATITRAYNGAGTLDSKGSSTCINSYGTASGGNGANVVTAKGMQGEAALFTMSGLGDKFVTTEGYPVLSLFLDEQTDANVVLGTDVSLDGLGTEEDPYLISDPLDLEIMVGTGGQGAYYKLTNDIYVNDVNAVDWLTGTVNEGYAPTEWFSGDLEGGQGYTGYTGYYQSFSGTVDGNGYAVHGLYYELGNTHTLVGFIPYASFATITDLGIEDSFIGGGRFTGGMVGYTTKGGTVTVTGSYIDDSCAVLGWDAGAAYVDADSDIHTSGGSGLCTGNATNVYIEDAAGTYILDGETYREFTAADYIGTKYAYDEETASYVESEEGTYLLDADGETYRAITIDDYTGTRYSVDIVWSNVGFTSEAVGGIIGRVESTGVGTIENCYVTANVSTTALYIYGFNSQGVTFKEEGTNGSACGHVNGLWGDDWGATVTVTDCFSTKLPHENINEGKTTFTNVYTTDTKTLTGVTNITVATGAEGLSQMTGLDTSVWYAVKADGAYPQLRLRGTVIGDVDENGVGCELTDAAALRLAIIKNITPNNGDYDRSSSVNVCDLVALCK